MAYLAKDKTPFTNASSMRSHDMKISAKPAVGAPKPEAKPKSEATNEMDAEREKPMDESQDPSEVVAEHGPAEEVTVSHKDGQHKVMSKHADGHKHTSEHASASEAHDAAQQLSGGDQSQEEPAEQDNSDMGGSAMNSMMGQ
jgi:hypothetical protein